MKTLTLVKISPNIQLGHMYEHIYCQRMAEYLYEVGLFEFIDYNLTGKTYHGGVIVVEYIAYTDEAKNHQTILASLIIKIDQETMLSTLNEIEAENQEPIGYTSINNVLDGLRKLQDQPWQQIDEIDTIDTRTIRRRTKPLYIVEGSYPRSKKLFVRFELPSTIIKNKRHLLPLYDRLTQGIGNNVQYLLTKNFGLFYKDDRFVTSSQRFVYTLEFNTYPEFDFDNEEIEHFIRDCHEQLTRKGGYERLLQRLQTVDNINNYMQTPNSQLVYENTLQIIGADGWREIANTENCRLLLNSTTVSVKFGRRLFHLSLRDN